MNRNSRLAVAIIATLYSVLSLGQADPPDKSYCDKVLFTIVSKINAGLKARGISDLVTVSSAIEVAPESDVLGHQTLIEISSNPEINVEILSDTRAVVSFYRDLSNFPKRSYDVPPKPRWTKAQALADAKSWYVGTIGDFPNDVGPPIVEWRPGVNSPKYYDGVWYVRWPRKDDRGHLFDTDTLNVILDEKHGITYLANNFVSKFVNQRVLISKLEATKLAQPIAEKMLRGPLAASWSKGLDLESNVNAELGIVNPNHILSLKSVEDLGSASDPQARLAWVVKYRASNASGMGSNIYVWIDTETKEVLGGDFQ